MCGPVPDRMYAYLCHFCEGSMMGRQSSVLDMLRPLGPCPQGPGPPRPKGPFSARLIMGWPSRARFRLLRKSVGASQHYAQQQS